MPGNVNDVMRNWTRDRFAEIWQKVKAHEDLDGEDEILARQMQDHPDYHHVWEYASQIRDPDFNINGTNPFLHVALHTVVEKQLLDQDPPEVYEVFHAKLRRGEDRHDILHEIAGELVKQIFAALKTNRSIDMNRYIEEVRKLA